MKDIKVGFIGLGGRGQGLLGDVVLPQKEQVTAVCDAYEERRGPRRERRTGGTGSVY